MAGLEGIKDGCVVAFFDIDGTLTRRAVVTGNINEMPGPVTDGALRDFVAAGNLAFLSSGRGPLGLARVMDAYPFAGYIAIDGSQVVLGNEVIVHREFEQDVFWDIIDEVMELGVVGSFEGVEYNFGLNTPPERKRPELDHMDFSSAEDLREVFPHPNVGKMNIMGTSWPAFRDNSKVFDRVELFDAGTGAKELAPKGVGKDKGARALLEALPVKPSLVMAFGDSENDKPLLEFADYAVVMGDSDPALLKIADLVTGTAEEDGVGHALNSLREYWQH